MNVNGHVFVLQSLEDLKRREKKIQIFLTALLLHLLLRISVNTQKKVDAFMSVVRTGKTTLKKKYFTVELVIKDYEIIDFKDKEQNTEDNKMEEAPFPPE